MKLHDFIFSEKITLRVSRHLLFWSLSCSFFSGFLFFQHIGNYFDLSSHKTILEIATDLPMANLSQLIRDTGKGLSVIIVYTYLVTYWLVPHYLNAKKYLAFGSWFIIVTVLIEICLLYLAGLRINTPKGEAYFILWFAGLGFVNDGPPIFCGLFLTIKMVKTWYVKQEEESTLIRENSKAELQLLKAQVHPHFLFNTLNNIYSFALSNSSKAPELVLKLSDVLKYMINDCDASLVPVEKELKLLENYIGLEQVRYGNRLNLDIQIKGDHQNKFIAPLLMIPLVENSFKHGTSRILKNSWFRLRINLSDEILHFTLINSTPVNNTEKNGKNGIGLSNVKKRLQLLYPGQHTLLLEPKDESFTVEMKIPLHNSLNPLEPIKILSIQSLEPAYVGA